MSAIISRARPRFARIQVQFVRHALSSISLRPPPRPPRDPSGPHAPRRIVQRRCTAGKRRDLNLGRGRNTRSSLDYPRSRRIVYPMRSLAETTARVRKRGKTIVPTATLFPSSPRLSSVYFVRLNFFIRRSWSIAGDRRGRDHGRASSPSSTLS